MQFLLSHWKLYNHFCNNQACFSVCEVFISSRSSTVRGVMFTRMVTPLITIYPIPTVYQRMCNQLIKNFALTVICNDFFLGILVNTAWFYCKQLQSDDAINLCNFFWTISYILPAVLVVVYCLFRQLVVFMHYLSQDFTMRATEAFISRRPQNLSFGIFEGHRTLAITVLLYWIKQALRPNKASFPLPSPAATPLILRYQNSVR